LTPECGRGDGAVLAMSGFLSFFFLADLGVAVVNMETLQGFVAFHQKPLEMPWFLLMDQFWRWIRLV